MRIAVVADVIYSYSWYYYHYYYYYCYYYYYYYIIIIIIIIITVVARKPSGTSRRRERAKSLVFSLYFPSSAVITPLAVIRVPPRQGAGGGDEGSGVRCAVCVLGNLWCVWCGVSCVVCGVCVCVCVCAREREEEMRSSDVHLFSLYFPSSAVISPLAVIRVPPRRGAGGRNLRPAPPPPRRASARWWWWGQAGSGGAGAGASARAGLRLAPAVPEADFTHSCLAAGPRILPRQNP